VYRFDDPHSTRRIRVAFRDFHSLSLEGYYEYPAHTHSDYEVILIITGPYRCTINGIEIEANDGELVIIQPGDRHQDHLREGQLHYVLHFNLLDEYGTGVSLPKLFDPALHPRYRVIDSGSWDCTGFFTWMEHQNEIQEKNGGIPAALVSHQQDARMELFFWEMFALIPPESVSADFAYRSNREAFRSALLRVFAKHVDQNMQVPEMANHMNMSPRTLSSLCRKYMGTSPARAFLEFRIRRSAEHVGTRSLQEISTQFGFSNQFHYSRAFKSVCGTTPSKRGLKRIDDRS
jgi:AraC-like DNA-binding protein